jgi:biotin operon repressor
MRMSEPTPDPGSNGRRGKPRPLATIQRDEQVKAALAAGPLSRQGLAEKLGWESKDVYASLWRLRHYGNEVEKTSGKNEWQLTNAVTG